jgi:hypothetical protein
MDFCTAIGLATVALSWHMKSQQELWYPFLRNMKNKLSIDHSNSNIAKGENCASSSISLAEITISLYIAIIDCSSGCDKAIIWILDKH